MFTSKPVIISLVLAITATILLFTNNEYILPRQTSKETRIQPPEPPPVRPAAVKPIARPPPPPQPDTSSILNKLMDVINSPEWLAKLTSHMHQPAAKKDDPKPRYIFVDLGANAADSLEVFYQNEGSKYQYDYPRPDWAKHAEAEVFLFEANPVFNPKLVSSKEKYTAEGRSVTIFPSTVVDIRDGTRTFFLDTVNKEHDFWGSSIYATHPDSERSGSKGTELSAINIARWLLMNTLPRDFVVVKMDIEGAEYEVLPHMVEMGCGQVIDHLLVEWHSGISGVSDNEDTVNKGKAAAEALKKVGVDMPSYDSGA